MNPLEAAGTALGLANLWLTRQQNILCWPVGIACVVCYALVFYEARLYSDLLLQFVYVALQVWGWRLWARGARRPRNALISERPITRLPARAWLIWLALSAGGAAALGTLMATHTRADLPYWDAAPTTLSLIAQYLQAKKVLDSWVLFIAANLIFIGVYLVKGLHLTAGLFAVSTVLAVSGWFAWRAALAR